MANEFWGRWSRQYLQASQERQKWNGVRRNMQVDDIVLLIEDDVTRSKWPMGRVTKVHPSDDELVRKVDMKVAGSKTPLTRPVTKLVLLIESDLDN